MDPQRELDALRSFYLFTTKKLIDENEELKKLNKELQDLFASHSKRCRECSKLGLIGSLDNRNNTMLMCGDCENWYCYSNCYAKHMYICKF